MTTKPTPPIVAILTERSLPGVLVRLALGGEVAVLRVRPRQPGLAGVLRRIDGWLQRFAGYRTADAAFPALARYRRGRIPAYYDDVFARAEPWLEEAFRFADADGRLGPDAVAYKQALCNASQAVYEDVFLIRRMAESTPGGALRVVGAAATTAGVYRAVYGDGPVTIVEDTSRIRSLVNLFTAGAAAGALAAGAVARGGRTPGAATPVFLGWDFSDAPYDQDVWREMATEGKSVLVVYRSADQKAGARRPVTGFDSAVLGDGVFGPGRAVAEWAKAVAELARMVRFAHRLPTAYFRRVAGISYKRLLIRKLLATYAFDAFVGRDDYNVEHLLRSQELRRAGGKSIGVSHAVPCTAAVVPMWRHIDFDTYITFGPALHDTYYARTWAADMTLAFAPSFGLTRERARDTGHYKGRDILFAAKPSWNVDALAACLDAVADAFPDRRIVVHAKGSFTGYDAMADLRRAMAKHPETVVESDDNIYDLMLDSRMLVTDPSAVAVEGVQFGRPTVVLDIDDRASLYFRDFPGLCVRTPDALVDRLRALDANPDAFPWAALGGLTAHTARTPGNTLYDRFRDVLGLAANAAPAPDRDHDKDRRHA